ncbi:hypothetical protein EMPS_01816 [Entomortierella parvispora]|uniref:Uncharacterized protein n=1 Tax=Entomortierella parvispora TaxID=205924 RepID=A0A9P3H3S5_9FUNG|nr:hypothetical protein EMPS_01816 [Entomortierella parvispora]
MEHKKSKRKLKTDDDLNEGSFKKALVTPSSTAFGGSLDDLAMVDSASDNSDSSDDEASEQMKKSSSKKTGVSEDVVRMQQQLQRQIPLESPAVAGTGLTQEQIMASLSGLPGMEMLLQGNTNNHTSQDATSILMSLSDPSILATVSSTTGTHIQPALTSHAAVASTDSNSKKSKSKKDKETKKPKGGRTPIVDHPPVRTLEEQLAYDTAGGENELHTKWLMATALKEKGIKYRTGTFSENEDQLIRQTIREYLVRNSMPADAIELWFQNGDARNNVGKEELKPLWVEIARRLETRPLLNIYLHVRRMFHPQNNIGVWTKEDDNKLVELFAKHKGQWTNIGLELGRMADSCRDRYRNNLKDRNTMVSGSWKPYEDRLMLSIMQEIALKQKKSSILESSLMWTAISEKMGGSRSRHQCRHRYNQTLQAKIERGEWKGETNLADATKAVQAAMAAAAGQVTPLEPTISSASSPVFDKPVDDASDAGQKILDALQGYSGTPTNYNVDDAAAFTAAITSASSMSNPPEEENVFPHRDDILQQILDATFIIQNSGETDRASIDWAPITEKLKEKHLEVMEEISTKIVKAQEVVESLVQKKEPEGEVVQTAAAAAAQAINEAATVVKHTIEGKMYPVPAPSQLQRGFYLNWTRIENHSNMQLAELLDALIKRLQHKIERKNEVDIAAQFKEDASKKQKKRAKAYKGDWSCYGLYLKRCLTDLTAQAALAALKAPFPEASTHKPLKRILRAISHKSSKKKKKSTTDSSSSDSSDDDDDDNNDTGGARTDSQAPSAGGLTVASPMDKENSLILLEETLKVLHGTSSGSSRLQSTQMTRDLAELMVSGALVEADMVSTQAIKRRFPKIRIPKAPEVKSSELVVDSDFSSDDSD